MNFTIRPAKREDLTDLLILAKQFSLLSLPADENIIKNKIETSIASFHKKESKENGLFLFVCEDSETQKVIACSLIKAKKGTPEKPCYSFRVLKKEHFSPDLSIGFIHQILRLKIETNGPSEIGGLVVHHTFRGRPEKIGRLMSLARFMYIKHCPEQFESYLLSEMAPPLLPDGRSEFWEALGRRFTGIPYKEADALTERNKEFIRSLFPQEDIYVCLLDAKARLSLAQVGKETLPALKMLKKMGFSYINEVDPFDGGPHYSVETEQNTIFKNSQLISVGAKKMTTGDGLAIISKLDENGFCCGQGTYKIEDESILLSEKLKSALNIEEGHQVLFFPVN